MKYNRIKIYLSIAVSILAFSLESCKNGSNGEVEATKEQTSEEEREIAKGYVALTPEQLKAVGIEVGRIEEKNLSDVVKASGQLEVPPQNRADINVLMGGIVQKINVLEGQKVEKGQVVAVLENADLIKLQQDYLSSKRGFSYIASEYTRQQELKEADAGTGKIYQQAEASYRAEQSRLLGMEKQLRQIGIDPRTVAKGEISLLIPIKAPIGGTVGQITINTGAFVQSGSPMMEIIDNKNIHCDLIVFEKDLFKVKKGQQVNFVLTNQNNAPIKGEIYGINKSFQNESKGIVVHAIIKGKNKYNLIPGMYVSALIDVGHKLSPAVPQDAVVRSGDKNYIFLKTETDKPEKKGPAGKEDEAEEIVFKKVEVATGVSELGYTQITPLAPLPLDAQIITKGAFYALSKAEGGQEEEE